MDSLITTKLDLFRRELEKFVIFSDEEWAIFASYVKVLILKKKAYLAQEGKICDLIAFILNGSVRYYHLKDGEEITSYFSFERECTSSYNSFLTRQPSNIYIQALEDTQLLTLNYADVQTMYANPKVAYKMERFGRRIAEFYLICYDDRVTSFITQSPEERYLKLLENGRDILQRIPQHYIATFLGITPVSLSRIRRRMLKSA